VLLALVAAACGGDGDEGTEGAAGTEAEQEEAVDADEVDRDAVLRFGAPYFGETANFDPHRVATAVANVYLFPVYDRLVHLDPDASPIPGLATDWTFEEDGTVLTMELREGVTFHDGTPFDAEAVQANIERGQTLEGSTVQAELAVIEEVEVVDTHEVRLHLTAPSTSLPLVLSDRAGAMISPAAHGNEDLSFAPVGSGMYEVTDYVPGGQAVYSRYEGYWDPDAALLRELVLINLQDAPARLNALRAGEIDATELDVVNAEEAEGSGLSITAEPGLVYMNLYLNRTRSAFADVRVRRALNHALDRQAFVDFLAFGYGEVASQPFPEGYIAHNPEAEGLYPYDPDRARELLAEAGLGDGFTFEAVIPPIDSYVQHAEAIQAQLLEVGIRMELTQHPDINQAFFVEQARDAMVSIWTGRPDPQMTVNLLYTSSGFSNAGRHSTPEVEELQAEALATTDPDERMELLQALSLQIMEDALAVPIYFPEQVVAFKPEVVGLQPWTSGKVEFRGVGLRAG
jgi:peptide/nickel transport system substrate-binding protein